MRTRSELSPLQSLQSDKYKIRQYASTSKLQREPNCDTKGNYWQDLRSELAEDLSLPSTG